MAVALAACESVSSPDGGAQQGRLSFRPPRATRATARSGRVELQGAAGAQPATLYVPAGAGGEPLRLAVLLHGAGGDAQRLLEMLGDEADRHRLLLMAPTSAGATWDVLTGGFGPDVRNIDRLLTEAAKRCPIRGYTLGGFSDGASYALSLGLTNGDVFDSIIAFSPGFEAAEQTHGRPRVFVSHGTQDRTLPIDRTSRRIVPSLEDEGYDVTYQEFEGGHFVPQAIQRQAVEWLEG
jgi:predicted esterase